MKSKNKGIRKETKEALTIIVPVVAGILAFLLALLTPGAYKSTGQTSHTEVNLIGLMFGKIKYTIFGGHLSDVEYYNGALSLFALLSVICLFVGIALSVASVYFKGKILTLIGAILILVSGVLIFFTLVVGSSVVYSAGMGGMYSSEIPFSEFFHGWGLGYGVYIYGIVCITGGAFGVVNYFKK